MQKTAYEVRISDCSSDVCASDLNVDPDSATPPAKPPRNGERHAARAAADVEHMISAAGEDRVREQRLNRPEQAVDQPLRLHPGVPALAVPKQFLVDRKSTRLNSSH